MSAHKPKKFERTVIKMLKASGLPFRIEQGLKHHKVFINNELVQVLSLGAHGNPDTTKLQCVIKRLSA